VTDSPPPAEGQRVPWSAVPAQLRAAAERLLRAKVTRAVTQPGGFSPGVAARLTLADGRRAFVKAVGDLNPESPGIHRAEAQIAAALPAATPAARLLGCVDADGWVILLFEDIEGRMPRLPWRPGELRQVLDAMTELAAALTPAPVDAPPAVARFANIGQGWRALHEDAQARTDVAIDPWARRHLDELVAIEERWPEAVSGRTLAHGDIRADNILLTRDRVVFVDWPWANLAAPWFDLAALLPSVAMQGGPAPEEIFGGHPVSRGADPEAVTAVVAALAGVWTWLGGQPAPPGLPTLRAFQRAQASIALDWLKQRLGVTGR
jgi:aminoglycoside phosphotransferase (APT) family kinase protein